MSDKPVKNNKLYAPSTQRNVSYIIDILKKNLVDNGHILEVASGSGQHIIEFASALPFLSWQPSDPDEQSRISIDCWVKERRLTKVSQAINLDMTKTNWPSQIPKKVNAIIAINMIHISPWSACCGLLYGASKLLGHGEVLYTYGPYKRDGKHTSQSNQVFEDWLKEKDPRFGIRDINVIEKEAEKVCLKLKDVVDMPANNFSLVFKKTQ